MFNTETQEALAKVSTQQARGLRATVTALNGAFGNGDPDRTVKLADVLSYLEKQATVHDSMATPEYWKSI